MSDISAPHMIFLQWLMINGDNYILLYSAAFAGLHAETMTRQRLANFNTYRLKNSQQFVLIEEKFWAEPKPYHSIDSCLSVSKQMLNIFFNHFLNESQTTFSIEPCCLGVLKMTENSLPWSGLKAWSLGVDGIMLLHISWATDTGYV